MANDKNKNNMDPFSLGAAGVTGAFGLLGNLIQQRNMRKQMDFQATENQKDRDFNSKEAELQRQFNSDEAQKARDYNTEMWNAENAYNAPNAVMQRLKEAGLNPNLVYGDIGQLAAGMGSTGVSASSGAASHAGSYASSMPGFVNPAKEAAEVALLQAQAKKTANEAGLSDIALRYADEFERGKVSLQNMDILFREAQKNLTEEEKNEVGKHIELMEEEMKNLASMIEQRGYENEKTYEETLGLILDNKLKDANFENAVAKFAAETKMAKDHASLLVRCLLADIYLKNAQAGLAESDRSVNVQKIRNMVAEYNNIVADTKNKNAYYIQLGYENERLKLELGEMERHDYRYDPDSVLGIIVTIFDYLGDCLRGIAGGLLSGGVTKKL